MLKIIFIFLASSVVFANTNLSLQGLTDNEVRQVMINESTNNYSGKCACPYFVNGISTRKCGDQSAYTRRGGGSPLCYKEDISQEMLNRYKNRQINKYASILSPR